MTSVSRNKVQENNKLELERLVPLTRRADEQRTGKGFSSENIILSLDVSNLSRLRLSES